MSCLICKNVTYKNGKVTVKLERGEAIVLIKDVPAEICDTCGNYLLDTKTSTEILDLANDSFKAGAELEVIRLRAA
ncbi:MAG: type II toxin-antitoxin system MqsA family antitoxin [Bacteroidetes bacterium]|nr:type II toxin-antitoxin system MqsA family antitoxin [Bacteroidota bacterium]